MMLRVGARWWMLAAAAAAVSKAEGMGRNRSFIVHTNQQEYDYSLSQNADCLFRTRIFMRPYPYDCYSHTFIEAWNEFTNFFKEIGGDFRFTFDFVLYDKNFPFAKENQLWYLIAFLKELHTLVPNPNHILVKGGADEELEKFRAALEARLEPVRTEYVALIERLQEAWQLAYPNYRKSHPSSPSSLQRYYHAPPV